MHLEDVARIDIGALPHIPFDQQQSLPRTSAIYFAMNSTDTILYIGKAKNLKERWRAHHRQSHLEQAQCIRIAWLCCDTSMAAEIEYALIQHFTPPFNSPHVGMAPPPRSQPVRESVTVRLTSEARRLLQLLSDKHGLTATSVIEVAIREEARRLRIK